MARQPQPNAPNELAACGRRASKIIADAPGRFEAAAQWFLELRTKPERSAHARAPSLTKHFKTAWDLAVAEVQALSPTELALPMGLEPNTRLVLLAAMLLDVGFDGREIGMPPGKRTTRTPSGGAKLRQAILKSIPLEPIGGKAAKRNLSILRAACDEVEEIIAEQRKRGAELIANFRADPLPVRKDANRKERRERDPAWQALFADKRFKLLLDQTEKLAAKHAKAKVQWKGKLREDLSAADRAKSDKLEMAHERELREIRRQVAELHRLHNTQDPIDTATLLRDEVDSFVAEPPGPRGTSADTVHWQIASERVNKAWDIAHALWRSNPRLPDPPSRELPIPTLLSTIRLWCDKAILIERDDKRRKAMGLQHSEIAIPPIAPPNPSFAVTTDLRATSDVLWSNLKSLWDRLVRGGSWAPAEWAELFVEIRDGAFAAGLRPHAKGIEFIAATRGEVKSSDPAAVCSPESPLMTFVLYDPGESGSIHEHLMADGFREEGNRVSAIRWAERWMMARERQLCGVCDGAGVGVDAGSGVSESRTRRVQFVSSGLTANEAKLWDALKGKCYTTARLATEINSSIQEVKNCVSSIRDKCGEKSIGTYSGGGYFRPDAPPPPGTPPPPRKRSVRPTR